MQRRMEGRAVSQEEAERETRTAIINEEEDTVNNIMQRVMEALRFAPGVFATVHGAVSATVATVEAVQRGVHACPLM